MNLNLKMKHLLYQKMTSQIDRHTRDFFFRGKSITRNLLPICTYYYIPCQERKKIYSTKYYIL